MFFVFYLFVCLFVCDGQDKKESVFFECLSAEDSVLNGQCTDADVILVDPPRKGGTACWLLLISVVVFKRW